MSEKKSPFITVAIPAFNHENFVAEAIESVLDQSFQDWELIVIDDGSTDETPTIIDKYANHPKVKIVHQQNIGLSGTLNRALNMAQGKYFNFLPSDDYFHRAKLERQVQAIKASPELICVFTDQIPVDENGKPIDGKICDWHSVPYETGREILPHLFERNFIPAPSALVHLDTLKQVGGFDEALTYTQDYDLWLRILPRGEAYWLHEPLLYYRWHGENLTFKAEESISLERAYLLVKALSSLKIEDIFPELKTLSGEQRKKQEAKKLVILADLLMRSGLIEMLPWAKLFIEQAKRLDRDLQVPKIILKRLEERKGFMDLRDDRLLELSKKLALTEGELANFRIHAESPEKIFELKGELERYKKELPDILQERKNILTKEKELFAKEKDLLKWAASLEEKHRWLEGYHKDLQAREAFLNRPAVFYTVKLLGLLSHVKKRMVPLAQSAWHLLPFSIRAKYGPKLKAKLLATMDRQVAQPPQSGQDVSAKDDQTLHDSDTRQKYLASSQSGSKTNHGVDTPPLVTVVLPIYNHASSARLSIESILNQTYPNIQVVVVNDGSTDNLNDVLAPYIGRRNFVILEQENQKLPKALSNGFRFAQGNLYSWTSADNIMLPWQIETEFDFLARNPRVDMTYGNVEIIDEKGRPLSNSDYRPYNQDPKGSSILNLPREVEALDSVPDNFINAAFMYRQEVGQALGPYDPRLLGTEDYDYWLRVKELFHIEKVDTEQVLYQYRVHANSLSGKYGDTEIHSNVKKLIEEHKQRKEYYKEPFSTFIWAENPIEANTPLALLAQGLYESGCNFKILSPSPWEDGTHSNLPHMALNQFLNGLTPECLHRKVLILSTTGDIPEQLMAYFRDKDLWVGLIQDKNSLKATAPFSKRAIILSDQDKFRKLMPPQREEYLFVPTPLSPPNILRKARDDRFPLWQFPWQGGPVAISLARFDALDEELITRVAKALPEYDFVFASWNKEDAKNKSSIFKAKNIHFFHYENLEQLYPLLGAVTLTWAPVVQTAQQQELDILYGWSLAAAKTFVAPLGFKYSPIAPYWRGFQDGATASRQLSLAAKEAPDRKVCDEFLERYSPNSCAKYLMATANNDLFIDTRCGGKESFKPKMPRVVTPPQERKNIALAINSLDKGGLEEVVYTLAAQFDKRSFRPMVACAQKGGFLTKEALKRGLDVKAFEGDTKAYESFLKQEDICLVNSHYTEFGTELTKKLGIPHISTIHNAYVWFDKAQRKHFMEQDRNVDHYIAVSSSVKKYLTDVLNISPERVTVIPNGVDTVLLNLLSQVPPRVTREGLGLEEDDFVFLNPASLDGRKNHHAIISAVARLRDKFPNLKVLCPGNVMDENYFQGVQARVQELGLESQILFPGFIKEKADLYRLANAFLLPSIVEGWSIAMTEALYFGLPLVLTDVGGARDVITEDWIGILVSNSFGEITNLTGENLGKFTVDPNPSNLDELVAAMEDMITRRDFWEEHREDRRKLALEKYNIETMVKRTQETFEKFIN